MKKKTVILLTALCALSLLGGCGKAPEPKSEKENGKYNVEEYVALGEYKGLGVTVKEYTVTDEDVRNSIEGTLKESPSYSVLDKTTVEDGDVVDIDYEGTKDGEVFGGGTGEGYKLKIGSKSFIDGFEEGLVGAKVGDELDLELTFPEDYYSEEMAGQDVVFHVTVNSIVEESTMTYDSMTDEYVSAQFGYESVQEFLDARKKDLESDNAYYERNEKQEKVIEKVKEICKVEFPEGLLDQRVNEYKEEFAKMCKDQYGMEVAQYLEENYGGMTEEEFNTQAAEFMRDNLNLEFILGAIAKKEGIELDEEGFQTYVANIIANYGMENEEALYEQYGEDYVNTSYVNGKALEFIVENAAYTYEKAEAEPETEE